MVAVTLIQGLQAPPMHHLIVIIVPGGPDGIKGVVLTLTKNALFLMLAQSLFFSKDFAEKKSG